MSGKPKVVLVKLGGSTLSDVEALTESITALRRQRAQGVRIVVVHGGGPAINRELEKSGIQWSFVNGQRVTTAEMIAVIEKTLCEIVNQDLVAKFKETDLPATGYSAARQNALICSQANPELGLVGKVEKVRPQWLLDILAQDDAPVPVIAPIGVGENGELYNVNADWAASHLAAALGVDQVIFITDQKGVLNQAGDLVGKVSSPDLDRMIDDKVVTGGMLVKVQAIQYALKNKVGSVRVTSAIGVKDPEAGTLCQGVQ